MQDAEQIRRFTRSVAMMKDPPWLPIAVWTAVTPVLVQFGVIARPWSLCLFGAAAAATALGSRWFKRTYGVVTPSPGSFAAGSGGAGGAVGVVVVVLGLEALASAIGLPVRLGLAAFGALLACGARASQGVRSHLYVFAAICVGVALLPLITELAGHRLLPDSVHTFEWSAFGVGWAYVCIEDYRVIVRNLRSARG